MIRLFEGHLRDSLNQPGPCSFITSPMRCSHENNTICVGTERRVLLARNICGLGRCMMNFSEEFEEFVEGSGPVTHYCLSSRAEYDEAAQAVDNVQALDGKPRVNMFPVMMSKLFGGQTFFTTEGGYMGIAAQRIKQGDLVVLIPG